MHSAKCKSKRKQVESVCLRVGADTCVVLHQLLHRVKLGPGGDVVAAVVQLADLVMLDVVSLVVVPVTDGQRVSA